MKTDQVKRQYIETAAKMIEEQGISSLSARKISKEVGMNPANIYRHFDNLEQLMIYASVSVLKSYVLDIKAGLTDDMDSYEIMLNSWKIYCRHVFDNPVIYYQLFFGPNSSYVPDILKDYYQMYPEQLEGIPGGFVEVVTGGSFDERNQLLIEACCTEGYLLQKDVQTLNNMMRYLFLGYLRDAVEGIEADEGTSEHVQEQGRLREEFIYVLFDIVDKYLQKKSN